jgi:methylenetetrahydrofolate dehydrogenase (NADP+)/methenyltetrahydrofolate cyclohydrolase
MGQILDGKAIAAKVRNEAAEEVRKLVKEGVRPGLAVVLVGDNPASQVYVRGKTKACIEAGLAVFDYPLPASTRESELLALVEQLNHDPNVDGILVQLPLPPQISAERVIEALSPDKDVDGFHPDNVGRLWIGKARFTPCTPLGMMRLLEEAGIEPREKNAVILGRSNIVGKPMAALLLSRDATVTVCHSKTAALPEVIGRADILVAAIGRRQFVKGAWIKPGATVIDVGMNRDEAGRLCGDVEFAVARERAAFITPVPGGVGPMTIACLVANTVRSAGRRRPTRP